MINEKKRGLSPVIATMLLIALGVILAIIVFFWARSFIGESITKQNRKIEIICEQIVFDAEAKSIDSKVYITNTGNIPIYGVDIRLKKTGEIKKVGTFSNLALATGQADSVDVQNIQTGEELLVVPILLGTKSDSIKKAYVCDKDFGKSIIVG